MLHCYLSTYRCAQQHCGYTTLGSFRYSSSQSNKFYNTDWSSDELVHGALVYCSDWFHFKHVQSCLIERSGSIFQNFWIFSCSFGTNLHFSSNKKIYFISRLNRMFYKISTRLFLLIWFVLNHLFSFTLNKCSRSICMQQIWPGSQSEVCSFAQPIRWERTVSAQSCPK